MRDYDDDLKRRTLETKNDTAICELFVALRGTCKRDGNMYGAVIGDLPTGCAAFEKTRLGAILKCVHNLSNEEAKIPGKENTDEN